MAKPWEKPFGKWNCIMQNFMFVGNGMCDDSANTEECGWDNYECCNVINQRGRCQDCACHNSGQKQIDIDKGILK